MNPDPIKHQLYDFLRLIGMRNRLRCPICAAVGTWKPHGGWLDFEDERKVRRWLCKWCGYYVGPEGHKQAILGKTCWELDETGFYIDGTTPKNVVYKQYCREINPWAG